MTATISDAYDLFHNGSIALAQVESAGIRVDTDYLDRTILRYDKKIRRMEKELQKDKVWKIWEKKYGRKSTLSSRPQLGHVLFTEMGLPCSEWTSGGVSGKGRPSTTDAVLRGVDLPFVESYLRLEKLKKMRGTYLEGIRREVCKGFIHPSFNLAGGPSGGGEDDKGGARSFRSSSSAPNFQNIPVRNKEIAKIIRKCFIPRDGYLFGEIDFGAIEVRVRACYSKDPVLIKYVTNPKMDMHRDWACKCFLLEPDQVSKDMRYVAKNQFVFPKFYGSYYRDFAIDMWSSLDRMKLSLPDGTPLKKHLKSRGIKRLGACDPQKRPVPGTFEHHIQEIEQEFEHTFAVDTSWKKQRWEEYLETGRIEFLTGFVAEGVYRKNQVINLGVQGAAFHCLLQSLIWLQRWLRGEKMQTLVIGQIHDSVVLDILEEELEAVLAKAHTIMTKELPTAWDWLVVPLIVEAEVAPLGKSWWDKRPVQPMSKKGKRLEFDAGAEEGKGEWLWN